MGLSFSSRWRAFTRQGRHRVPESRDAIFDRLDAVHGLRGAANPARRLSPDAIDGAAGRIHIEMIAAAEARGTVVFMPGTNAYAILYADFLAALADRGYNAVGFDPRGHGLSEGRRGSYDIPELLDDMNRVVAFAAQRFQAPVAVSGSSQGGITAFYYAARGRSAFAAVCHNAADLAHPDAHRLTRIPPAVSRILAPGLRLAAQLVPEWPVPMTAYLDLAREPVRGLGTARDVLYADPTLVPFVRLKTLASLSHEPLPCPVESIPTPVMILHAGADTIFPEDMIRSLYARLPEPKRLAVYPGRPHYLIVDYVEDFVDDVVAWLDTMLARREAR